jgi:hypothetical protein
MSSSLLTELEPLAKLLEKDEPKVLVVVGAGVSIDATSLPHASWRGMLKHGVEHLVKSNILTSSWGKALAAALDKAFLPFDLQRVLELAETIERNFKSLASTCFATSARLIFQLVMTIGLFAIAACRRCVGGTCR